jgi:peptidyl-dipeptidase A
MTTRLRVALACSGLLAVFTTGCTHASAPASTAGAAADAKTFLDSANQTLLKFGILGNQGGWIAQNFITDDTAALNARISQESIEATVKLAKDATKYDSLTLPEIERRQMNVLKTSLVMVTPSDLKEAEELTTIMSRLEAAYGTGKWCKEAEKPGTCLNIDQITEIMATSRDEKRLREVWEGWHTISPLMKKDYARFVELSNKGAKELGFADTGVMWRMKYDMPPDAFSKELDRLWMQVQPLYLKLHAYVRLKLREKYGDVVPEKGPIPAHLLGNIWAQEWENVYSLVAPRGVDAGYSLDDILRKRKPSATDMVRTGEHFYTSLGFDPLPKTFWERSLFVRPKDRDVVCHASAWDIDLEADVRIKMCITPTAEDFTTIHHELGHNFYQRAYMKQPVILRDSANDGFHEAVGDTIALSVTPEYLVKIGLLGAAPDASHDTGLLLRMGLERFAFLPFALVVDEWRWKVFSGEVKPADYNKAWWELRLKYQGVAPPSPRGEEFFDAGAKYHVPDNTPYMRYFLARILQFQFHRALSKTAGCTTPLHRCSIYESKDAGQRLGAMLSLGMSKPWPDALEALTGSRQMDATAILDYFAPLSAWLDQQLAGKPVGW